MKEGGRLRFTLKLPSPQKEATCPQQHHFSTEENRAIEVEVKRILQNNKAKHLTFRSERDQSPLSPTGTTYWQKYIDAYGPLGFDPNVWKLLAIITQKARKLGRVVSNMVRRVFLSRKKNAEFFFPQLRAHELTSDDLFEDESEPEQSSEGGGKRCRTDEEEEEIQQSLPVRKKKASSPDLPTFEELLQEMQRLVSDVEPVLTKDLCALQRRYDTVEEEWCQLKNATAAHEFTAQDMEALGT
jgi:hypothetical protein